MIVKPSSHALDQALSLLKAGGLIGLPTETVYGLAGDAAQDLAVAKIFAIKQRPLSHPLILLGSSTEDCRAQVVWNETADKLAHAFWPGPLTLVLPRLSSTTASLLVSAGGDSLGVRVPNHPVALALLAAFGKPVAAPSANPFGKPSPTTALQVEEAFPELFILDGGNTRVGIESTIVDLTGQQPLLLRLGGISREDIEAVIGCFLRAL